MRVPPPFLFHLAAAMLHHGTCSPRSLERHQQQVIHQHRNSRDGRAEVDEFINDNNEGDEDDDNINN